MVQQPSSRRSSRIVVSRRIVRASPTFRSATASDIDQLLQMETNRQLITYPSMSVDIPPTISPLQYYPISSQSDIGSIHKQLNEQGALPDRPTIDLVQLAAMDDCNAVAAFLHEIRRHRKHANLRPGNDTIYQQLRQRESEGMLDSIEVASAKRMSSQDRRMRVELDERFSRRSFSADDQVTLQSQPFWRHCRTGAPSHLMLMKHPNCEMYDNDVSEKQVNVFNSSYEDKPAHFRAQRSQSEIGAVNRENMYNRKGLKPLCTVGHLPNAYAPLKNVSFDYPANGYDNSFGNFNGDEVGHHKERTVTFCGDDEDDDFDDKEVALRRDRRRRVGYYSSMESTDPGFITANQTDAPYLRKGIGSHSEQHVLRKTFRKNVSISTAPFTDSWLLQRFRSFGKRFAVDT